MADDEWPAGVLEPTIDSELAPAMEPAPATMSSSPSHHYWEAQAFANALHEKFEDALERGDYAVMRRDFYVLARFYGRTMAILQRSLAEKREALVNIALRNLVALHEPMHHMHDLAPGGAPLVLTLEKNTRGRLLDDLIIKVLDEAPAPIEASLLERRVNELHVLGNASRATVATRVDRLREAGYVEDASGGLKRSHRGYTALNLDRASLEALLGTALYAEFSHHSFRGMADLAGRRGAFRDFFAHLGGFGPETADLFSAVALELVRRPDMLPGTWPHADLIDSVFPRPYQRQAFAIFRGYGYQGQLIEAPTGSGKTMIGMMCIEDWLHGLGRGESVLVVVPTINYQQQWLVELCYKHFGLRLSTDLVFSGTPGGLAAEREATGTRPAVLVMTYSALAQAASGAGKGGVDRASIERFLQGSNVQYVILDEVHKVVEDLHSASADVTRLLVDWLRDGSLRGLIGFSGTAAAQRARFAELGLELVYVLPAAELIAYGFVAPFAAVGLPFAFSDRERRVRELLEGYRDRVREFIDLLGSDWLRERFGELPLDERVAIGRDVLRMYAGREGRDEELRSRFAGWEQGPPLSLNDVNLITILQIGRDWSDEELMRHAAETGDAGAERVARFQGMLAELEEIKRQLREHIYLRDIAKRLEAAGFGTTFQGAAVRRLPGEVRSSAALAERVRDQLATTLVGLYEGLRSFYLRVGEGRLDTIKAIIEAETSIRSITGVIVFDDAKRLHWEEGVAVPGYGGVAGVFGQMLGDARFVPMAALSSELYLPYDDNDPLPARIAQFIKQRIMLGELSEGLFSLLTQGLELSPSVLSHLQEEFSSLLSNYVESLAEVRAPRPREFNRFILLRLLKKVRRMELGRQGEQLEARLSLKRFHLRKSVDSFFHYAEIASAFARAHVAELEQVSGARRRFYVIRMPTGERKQLLYDLTARIVDAPELPVNMVIVSLWARTGWNVIQPNLLIDATATRDVTAWQQLRGRAMRALPSWDQTCYRAVMQLLGTRSPSLESAGDLLPDAAWALDEHGAETTQALESTVRDLLASVHSAGAGAPGENDVVGRRLARGRLAELKAQDRTQLVVELMLARNKVTHIYELVKAYGGDSQVRFERGTKKWECSEPIGAKHAHEYSVSPLTGRYGAGVEHAPLLYAGDPRNNVPSELRALLAEEMNGRDALIVRGWLDAIASGVEAVDTEW
jgi:DEAD/DEAH box helicase